MSTRPPLILDLDGTAGVVPDAIRIDLADWQEAVRFGCTRATFAAFNRHLRAQLPARYGTVLLGSGDFHHLSLPLIECCVAQGPFQVVLFDNHPDNMRFPWGIHCGSWVRHVAALPYVSHVHVVGITSQDVGLGAAWEQYWRPLLQNKLTYWCLDVDVRWARWAGLGKAFRRYDAPDAMIADFLGALGPGPIYLTIDKDALSPAVVRTNWDQGVLLERHLMAVIEALRGRILASDITGEVSEWTYRTWWKRLLSARDGQSAVPAGELAAWQIAQQALNRRLLSALGEAMIG